MTVLRVFVGISIVFTIGYIILKTFEYKESQPNTESKGASPKPREIEITSRDLYMEAENLIATHEIYALQIDNIVENIRQVEKKLDKYRMAKRFKGTLTVGDMIGDGSAIPSDVEAEFLISKSLKLQEQKCKIEAKMLKIMKQLDAIAEEEYRRQAEK